MSTVKVRVEVVKVKVKVEVVTAEVVTATAEVRAGMEVMRCTKRTCAMPHMKSSLGHRSDSDTSRRLCSYNRRALGSWCCTEAT